MKINWVELSQREWCERSLADFAREIAKDELALRRARGNKRIILAEGIASMRAQVESYRAELAAISEA